MSKETTEKENKKTESINPETKGFPPAAWAAISAISVALITCVGAIVAAVLNPDLVTVVSNRFLTPSPTPTSQTVIPATAISMVGQPPSNDPTTTPQSAQPSATPYIVAEDWKSNCISTANWQPYLAGEKIISSEPCYNLVDWGIAAYNGILSMNRSGFRSNTALEYGILTDIRGKTRFEFSVHIAELSSSEIWLGFLEGDTTKSEGVVVVIQHDDNFDVRPLPGGVEFVDNVYFELADGNYNNIRVVFNGATITVIVDKIKILEHPIGIIPTRLFLGYRALPNAQIEAFIYNVEVE